MSSLAPEVKAQLADVESSLKEVDEFFKVLQDMEYDEVTTQLDCEDRARYDLSVLYAINSLFWMLKRTEGQDPQEHGIKGEIDRVKQGMMRLKEIKDKAKMPRVNKDAAERVVRHGLNMPKRKKLKTAQDENWENEKKEEFEEQDRQDGNENEGITRL